ncbi:MAG: HD domain-containing phosphohydrolase [Acidimicrobiales bacterium]
MSLFMPPEMGSLDGSGTSVLVVDDDPSLRLLIVRTLERQNYACTQAPDAVTALTLAAEIDFDLAVCDVRMPEVSGLDLVRQLRNLHPETAVLMVSGLDDLQTAAAAMELGAYGYIIKPFEPNEIVIATGNALYRRRQELESRHDRESLEREVNERTADLASAIDRLSVTEHALRESEEDAIKRLAYAAEFHDPTTGSHINRMGRTCELIAVHAGLGRERAEMIRIASPMHDIGKIGVRDEILRKAGKLTPEEMEEMRRHPLIGSEILGGLDAAPELMNLGAAIALTHHERWDGNGYPYGLKKEAILLEGRIVAIADVFDALTSERSYKPAFEVDHALSIMCEERGRHFDPELLDVFLALLDEVADLALSGM